jgi:hypothetical protein
MVAPAARRESDAPFDGLRVERLTLSLDDGFRLPARLIHPRAGPARGTVLVADGAPRPAAATAGLAAAKRWARDGYLALVLDARGVGLFAPTRGEGGYTSDYQLAARAWLLGSSVVAWQTRDLLAGLSWLERELPGADRARLLQVTGDMGPSGIAAAALHRLDAVWAEGGLVSYRDLAETRDYAASARLFVPGVLAVTDLPELMAMARPATVHLVEPRAADGRPIADADDLRRRMGVAVPENVRFAVTPGRASKP